MYKSGYGLYKIRTEERKIQFRRSYEVREERRMQTATVTATRARATRPPTILPTSRVVDGPELEFGWGVTVGVGEAVGEAVGAAVVGAGIKEEE